MRDLTPCCICKSSEREVLFPATLPQPQRWHAGFDPYDGHYQINVCKNCGLLFSSPIFNYEDIEALYRGHKESNVSDTEIANVRRTMTGYYRLARPFIRDRERILDIGCDIGLLLEIARAEGFRRLYRLEPVAAARTQAVRRLPDAEISETFYENACFLDNYFDAIFLIHIVDHLVHPDRVLARVLTHLKQGGVCLAVVHDVESPLARVMGERFPIFNFFHHYFLSKQTLRTLFESCGFKVVCVAATRNCYSLSFFIGHAPFLPHAACRKFARMSRSLELGRIPLSIPVGNIGIVARKPNSASQG